MADLLRTVTIERGYDPREFVLLRVRRRRRDARARRSRSSVVDTVLVPASQSVHSALGAASSDVSITAELAVPMRLSRAGGAPTPTRSRSSRSSATSSAGRPAASRTQGVPERPRASSRGSSRCGFTRQTKALPVPYRGSVEALLEDFLARYAQRYGAEAVPDTAGFELVTFVVARPAGCRGRSRRATRRRRTSRGATATRRAYDAGADATSPTRRSTTAPAARPATGSTAPRSSSTRARRSRSSPARAASVDELLNIEIRRSGRDARATTSSARAPPTGRRSSGRSRSTRSRSRSSATSWRR